MKINQTSKMTSKKALAVTAVLVIFRNIQISASDKPRPISGDGPYDCERILLRATKATMSDLSKCSKEVKAAAKDDNDFSEKIACIVKCAMHKLGLTNDGHHVTNETLDFVFHQLAPNDAFAQGVEKQIVSECHGVRDKLDPAEELCKTYGAYGLCLSTAMEDFIKSSPSCIKKS